MPHVTVTLKYTPKPDDDVAFVEFAGDPEGLAAHFGHGRVWIEPDDLSSSPSLTPAEALALARALALVAGCADPRWRGWHWEAREANGHLLAETPLGEWYVNSYDCITAIGTLFGTESVVLLDDKWHGNVTIREPQPAADDEPTGVYVAGPMTGIEDYNYPAFHAAAAELRSRGMVVANPAEHFDGDQTLPYGVYIREAVRSLIGCAEVVTLPGWENSRGARLEVDIAEKIGMPVTTLAEKLAADDDTAEADL